MITVKHKSEVDEQGMFKLSMEVVEVTSQLPNEVFVWHVDLHGNESFSHIASVRDMSIFDGGSPSEGKVYFRKDYLENTFNSMENLSKCLVNYKEGLKKLEREFIDTISILSYGEYIEETLNEDIE